MGEIIGSVVILITLFYLFIFIKKLNNNKKDTLYKEKNKEKIYEDLLAEDKN